MIEQLLSFLPGILAAIVASYLTARWSLKKIYSEKWWERKERAYSEIIGSLYDVTQYCEAQVDYYESGGKYSEERMKEIQGKYVEAYRKLKKVATIGGFAISNEGARVLQDLLNRPKLLWEENHPSEIYDYDYKHYKQALEKFVEIANKDLKASKA